MIVLENQGEKENSKMLELRVRESSTRLSPKMFCRVCAYLMSVCVCVDVSLQQLAAESPVLAATDASLAFALLPSLFVLTDLANQRVECIVDPHSSLGGGFNEWHTILLGHLLRSCLEF